MTIVAPVVRFSAFAILVTPAFCFASDFSNFKSSFDHARRTVFFVFLAKTTSLHLVSWWLLTRKEGEARLTSELNDRTNDIRTAGESRLGLAPVRYHRSFRM
ncbi:hypothetical protein [Bradyrhizobium sp. 180]|uniref:hypothetical protein n=1 Tax=Bradyrhizobium sp. 180 TaxID=2782650 RepID=UPI0031F836D9